MRRRLGERTSANEARRRGEPRIAGSDLAQAGVVGLGALLLYSITLCPTVYVEDSPEFSTAAAVFGVPHPPGYPLYSALAGVFVRLLPVGDIAYRSNLFSAVCGALAVTVLWILLRRLNVSRPAALTATVGFGVGVVFWSQCLAAEVHALNCLLIGATLFFSFEAFRCPGRRTFILTGLLWGLAVGHRNVNFLFLGPLPVLLEIARRRKGCPPIVIFYGLAALALTMAVFLYLPLAAARDPWLNMGAPATWSQFWRVISTEAYFRHLATGSAATDLGRAVKFAKDLPGNMAFSIVAAPFGLVALYRCKEFWTLIPVAWIAASCFCFSICYNVVDVESYFIPAYLALAIAAGVGFDTWQGRWRRLLPVLAFVGIPLLISSVTLRHTTIARDYGRQLLSSAPPDAIVISFSDTETHVLQYEQGVEHARADAIVISASELADWYVDQLASRHPKVSWPPPTTSESWLGELIARNQQSRPICLTQPLDLGAQGWKLVPVGLLYCRRQGSMSSDLVRSVAFWKTAVLPSKAELVHPEVHVHMIDFAFALSRFKLAGALAESGDVAEARSQLAAVVAATPDVSERAIVSSMKTIRSEDHNDLALGRRAQLALSLEPEDPRFLQLLRL